MHLDQAKKLAFYLTHLQYLPLELKFCVADIQGLGIQR